MTCTSNIITAQFNEDVKHQECLLDLAEYLYKNGFISISLVYDTNLNRNQKVYSIESVIYNDEDGSIISKTKIPVNQNNNGPEGSQKQLTSEKPKEESQPAKKSLFNKLFNK